MSNLPLDEIFGGIAISSANAVAVAISGGSDSTALLFLLQDYFKTLTSPPRIIAITIDHGLRSGSAREALEVDALCARNGIEHVTSTWSGAKPTTGVQAAARQARYSLLSEAARRAGAALVLTGHTFDDQIETVAMRMKRDDTSGNAGLAGIAPCTLAFDDLQHGAPVWFARPLLNVRRAALRDYLTGKGIGWIDDPSNANDKYERVAVRQSLLDEVALAGVQNEAVRKRYQIANGAARLIEHYASEVVPGLIFVAPEIGGEPMAAQALAVLIAFAGGATWAAEQSAAETIVAGLATFKSGNCKAPIRMTASGALIDIRKDGVFLLREKRVILETAKRAEFDGFYRSLGGQSPDLGAAPHPTLRATFSPQDAGRRTSVAVPPSLLAHAAATRPTLESAAPVRSLLNPWADLVPLFDLEMAQALAKMIGLPALPCAPIHFDGKN